MREYHRLPKTALWISFVVCEFICRGAVADPPVISYVTQPVRHWETFFLFGEGFSKDVKVLRGVLHDARSPDELAAAIARGETFQAPGEPPKDVGDLYGRQYVFNPQVIGGKLQGEVQVFWVRSGQEISPPFVVNRPEVFFTEFDEVAPVQECRVFGRILDSSQFSLYPGERGIRLAPETMGTLLWHLNWSDGEPQIEDRGAATVTVPH